MKFDWVLIKVIHLERQFRRQFSTVFPCSFAGDIGCYYGNFPVNLAKVWLITAKVINEIGVKFDWVLLKVIHLDVNTDVNS